MLRTAPRRVLACALVVAASVLAVSCGNADSSPTIVVGAGDSATSELIAEIYAQALGRAGARTAVEPNLGSRRDYLAGLDANTVTLVGDESGDLLTFLDAESRARTPEQVTEAVNRSLPEGIVVSDPAEGTDLRPAMVVTEAGADRFDARSIEELAPDCGELLVGIADVSTERLPGLRRPLAEVYDCEIGRFRHYPSDVALRAGLLAGEVQAGILSGPTDMLPGGTEDLVALDDSDYAFRAENVIPMFRKGALTEHEILKLNYVAGELTTDDLAKMVRGVRDDSANPAELARDWLDEHAL